MKKIFCLLLAAAVTLSCAGCGNDTTASQPTTSSQAVVSSQPVQSNVSSAASAERNENGLTDEEAVEFSVPLTEVLTKLGATETPKILSYDFGTTAFNGSSDQREHCITEYITFSVDGKSLIATFVAGGHHKDRTVFAITDADDTTKYYYYEWADWLPKKWQIDGFDLYDYTTGSLIMSTKADAGDASSAVADEVAADENVLTDEENEKCIAALTEALKELGETNDPTLSEVVTRDVYWDIAPRHGEILTAKYTVGDRTLNANFTIDKNTDENTEVYEVRAITESTDEGIKYYYYPSKDAEETIKLLGHITLCDYLTGEELPN